MGRKPKPKEYLLLLADAVAFVNEEKVFEPDSEPKSSLMDELQCPLADDVLIALRRSFSLTYPRNPFIDGLQPAIAEIRKLCVDAVKPMPEVLADMALPPVPAVIDDPVLKKTTVFMFVFARRDLVDITVRYSGKRRKLLDLVQHREATELLRAIRSVITETFSEAHNEDQHTAILHRIRMQIHHVLRPLNPCLENIEIEPIADSVIDPNVPSQSSTPADSPESNIEPKK